MGAMNSSQKTIECLANRMGPYMDESDPDGYTAFLLEYFGNFEGEWVQPVSEVLVQGLMYLA
jgi:hypothetical protein